MRKGQVTIFVILGIVLVIIIFLLLFFSDTFLKERVEGETGRTSGIPSEVMPVVNYYEECIGNLLKEAMFLLGEQGGYIYVEQGGRTRYPPEVENVLYINYQGSDRQPRKVPYKIFFEDTLFPCNNSLPGYPMYYDYYPYASEVTSNNPGPKDYTPTRKTCFGTQQSLFMSKTDTDISSYINQNIQSSCDLDIFDKFIIQTGSPKVSVSTGSHKTTILVNQSVNITQKLSGVRTTVDRFKVDVDVGISRMFDAINKEIIRKDVTDPTFDISQVLGNYEVKSVNLPDTKDTVVLVSSPDFMLNGQKFIFQFARQNRPPVLDYIYDTNFNKKFNYSQKVKLSDVIKQNITAHDPDEQDVKIEISINSGYAKKKLTENQPYEIPLADAESCGTTKNYCEIPVIISATDGQYTDYQASNYKGKFTIKVENEDKI